MYARKMSIVASSFSVPSDAANVTRVREAWSTSSARRVSAEAYLSLSSARRRSVSARALERSTVAPRRRLELGGPHRETLLLDRRVDRANLVALDLPNPRAVVVCGVDERLQRLPDGVGPFCYLLIAFGQPDGRADEGPVLPALDVDGFGREASSLDVRFVYPPEIGAEQIAVAHLDLNAVRLSGVRAMAHDPPPGPRSRPGPSCRRRASGGSTASARRIRVRSRG